MISLRLEGMGRRFILEKAFSSPAPVPDLVAFMGTGWWEVGRRATSACTTAI